MSDQVSDPLLELIKEKGLIDDLQFEEVQAEHLRSAKTVLQILQDFGILDLDSLLQLIADHSGTEVVSVRDVEFTPELIKSIPAATARMYQCIPVAVFGSTIRVAFVNSLNPGRVDELAFVIRKDVQM